MVEMELEVKLNTGTSRTSAVGQTNAQQRDVKGAVEKRKRKRLETSSVVLQETTVGVASGKSIRSLRQQTRAPTYDEDLLDAVIDQQLGGTPFPARGRKRKPLSVEKEVDVEAMIAASIGFPRESLTEEEIEAGVVASAGSLEQANYIVVRNHILAKWRENVNAWLDEDTVMESIRSQHKSLVAAAYKFLSTFGYINFGVAPAIKSRIPEEATKATVIIIGAGLAGLAAARQLLAFGHKVIVLEGRQRPGGRVYTKKMVGEGLAAAADLGGSVVTGIHGNPLGVLARQLGFPLHKIREKCPLYQPGGLPVKEEMDARVEAQFNKLLDRASKWREEMNTVADSISLGTTLETLREDAGVAVNAEERQLFDWHLANLEYANAGLLSNLSLAFWDQDDPYEMGGDHCFLPGGNVRLVAALAEGVPIFYGKTIHTIRYSSEGVQVIAGEQIFEGDMALCTAPLGVLKREAIKFEPELPVRKIDAIKRLGFGLLNKVVMLFSHPFWGAELDTFGHLAESTNRRGEFFLFYSYAAVSGGPLLLALVAGEAAINFECMPPIEAVTRVLSVLRVGASGDDYDILAECVGDGRLFFAGEATNRRYPATMHGAFLSGLREAGNITTFAGSRIVSSKGERGIQKDIQSFATILVDIFKEPDLQFGCFSVVFDPQTNDLKSYVIVRLTIGKGERKEEPESSPTDQQSVHLYTIISRRQAFELLELRGGDKLRLIYLSDKLGVKLVGRRGLGVIGDGIVSVTKWNRAARKVNSPLNITPVTSFAAKTPKSQ
ncbi:hypothetical protein AXG93_496s1150 [Marchantia polymorpha subsp. ruderalis]|uniref:SWIRM domain-containing protein n=1 Tax=Marchantia polymorpha subsp. ruderalis TaxID=1480154 RepID=A0A176VPI6_MARPO|nr:hypothetical protein AXG93_496s1150 [Marchantia polymorpha subsp. ruderalis]